MTTAQRASSERKDHAKTRSTAPPTERLRCALIASTEVVTRNIEYAVERVFRDSVVAGVFMPDTDIMLTSILALSGANWLPNWFNPGGSLSQHDVAQTFVALLLRGIEVRLEG